MEGMHSDLPSASARMLDRQLRVNAIDTQPTGAAECCRCFSHHDIRLCLGSTGFVYKLPRAAIGAAETAAFLDSPSVLFDPKVSAGLQLAHRPGEFARIAAAKGR
jgi:hypothetical protein